MFEYLRSAVTRGAALALVLTMLLVGVAVAQTETTVAPAEGSQESTAPAEGSTEATATPAAPSAVVAPAPEDLAALNPDLSLETLVVQFWPEYDEPNVLVMEDLRLPADVQFPVQMQIPIPRGATLTGVAEVTEQGQFDYSRPAPTPALDAGTEEWDVYNITIPKLRDVRIEYYYDPGLTTSGTRDFSVVFRVPMDAAQSSLSVQQPLRSTNFATQPPLSQSTTDSQGFTYLTENLGAVEANQLLQVQVTYDKPDGDPSVATAQTETSSSNSTLLLALLGIVGVGILGFVAYRLWLRPAGAGASTGGRSRGGGGRGGRPSGGRASSKGGGKVSAEASGGPARFCTECGTKLNKRDRFCPQCGHERE